LFNRKQLITLAEQAHICKIPPIASSPKEMKVAGAYREYRIPPDEHKIKA